MCLVPQLETCIVSNLKRPIANDLSLLGSLIAALRCHVDLQKPNLPQWT